MGLFGLIFLIVALVVIGIGIALGVVACILTCAFLVLGIASSSFVIGFHRGHPVAGTRAFLVQCGILAGVPAGIVCVWSVQFVFGTGATGWSLLVCGAVGGALAGFVVALSLEFAFRRLYQWASVRFLPSSSDPRHATETNG